MKAEYPPGRGFVVKSVRTQLTQTAMPYNEIDNNVESILDSWIEQILEKYLSRKAMWRYQGAFAEVGSEDEVIQVDLSSTLEDIEMDPELQEEIHRQLEAMGLKPPD